MILTLACCTACGSSTSTPGSGASASTSPAVPPGTTTAASIVALGDSVPAGAACDCTPYPELTATDLSATSGTHISAHNNAVDGYTSSDVLDQLAHDGNVIDEVRAAKAVEVEVGANDVGHSTSCGTAASCYTPKVEQMQQNLRSIVHRLHELTAGHPAPVVLLDYWSVWLGGQYAQAQGEAYVIAAADVTDQVNAAIKTVAAETGSEYVDLRAAFKGPSYSYDETHYLASDGDHPNAAGHQRIAEAVAEVVRRH